MNKLLLYQTAHMDYPYTLPPLDHAYDALEPHIDEQTMQLHHDKHHQAYIDIRTPLQSNGGGHFNHALFWGFMTPRGDGEPEGKLARAITKTFGGFAQFKEEFDAAAKNRSGSGWAWLSVTSTGDLEIGSTANQNNPLSNGQLPILGLDVWEHAYYLKYHNKRPEYITHWWHVVNWKKVQEQFEYITG